MDTESQNSCSSDTSNDIFDYRFSPRIYEDDLGKMTYFHAPKCASRTILGWMAFVQKPSIQENIEFRDSFLLGDYPKITRTTKEVPFSEIRNQLKFCVVRDPVDRFVSAYKDRVLRYQREEVSVFPTIQHLLSDLQGAKKFRTLFHHLKPMVSFYGENPGIFDWVFSFSRLNEVRDFLASEYDVPLPQLHLQSSSKVETPELAPDEVTFIQELYAPDYEIYGKFI
jgi:hypothetical protein